MALYIRLIKSLGGSRRRNGWLSPSFVAQSFRARLLHDLPREKQKLNEEAQYLTHRAYAIAHAVMHLAFGHFDAENMPGYEEIGADSTKKWNVSCDIYITKFLEDIKFGSPCGMYRWLPTRARLRMSAAYTVISSKMAIRRESTALARPHTIASYAATKEVPCARVVFLRCQSL